MSDGIVPPMQPMTLFRANPPGGGRTVGTIAMVTRDEVKAATAISWLMTDYGFLGPEENVGRFIIQGNLLTMQRNECFHRMEGDWVLFIDDDMTWQPDAIRRIVETQQRTGHDIVGGLCFQRGSPHQPTMYIRAGSRGYTFMERWTDGDVVEVDGTGMAFCLITVEALNKIIRHVTEDPEASFPPYADRVKMPPPMIFEWNGQYGEDFAFCQLAKAAGCSIAVDTGIEIGHIGEHVITKRTFLREIAFRAQPVEAAKRVMASPLGVETMTRREALDLLEQAMKKEAAE